MNYSSVKLQAYPPIQKNPLWRRLVSDDWKKREALADANTPPDFRAFDPECTCGE